MKKVGLLTVLLLTSSIYARELPLSNIAVKPQAADYSRICVYQNQQDLPSLEQLLKPSQDNWNIDFRSCDLSQMDLSMYPSNLADYVDFDSKTKWPTKKKMPTGFNPKKYLKIGRNPGLHVRDLHKRGIDGRGVAIAIIDQPLLLTHKEYRNNIVLYEQQDPTLTEAEMHGPAVASIAVGETVGVAPKAKLYYVATRHARTKGLWDVRPEAEALQRILEINKELSDTEKIRIVSLSLGGLNKAQEGGPEWQAALQEAKKQKVAVFTTDDNIFTVSRKFAYANVDDNAVYTRGAYWWPEERLSDYAEINDVLFPSDYRVTAAPNGDKDYVAYSNGGMSWAVPYAAGLYALGLQVLPGLTPELFWQIARETAMHTQVQGSSGEMYPARYLVQPVKFIEKLESLKK